MNILLRYAEELKAYNVLKKDKELIKSNLKNCFLTKIDFILKKILELDTEICVNVDFLDTITNDSASFRIVLKDKEIMSFYFNVLHPEIKDIKMTTKEIINQSLNHKEVADSVVFTGTISKILIENKNELFLKNKEFCLENKNEIDQFFSIIGNLKMSYQKNKKSFDEVCSFFVEDMIKNKKTSIPIFEENDFYVLKVVYGNQIQLNNGPSSTSIWIATSEMKTLIGENFSTKFSHVFKQILEKEVLKSKIDNC